MKNINRHDEILIYPHPPRDHPLQGQRANRNVEHFLPRCVKALNGSFIVVVLQVFRDLKIPSLLLSDVQMHECNILSSINTELDPRNCEKSTLKSRQKWVTKSQYILGGNIFSMLHI